MNPQDQMETDSPVIVNNQIYHQQNTMQNGNAYNNYNDMNYDNSNINNNQEINYYNNYNGQGFNSNTNHNFPYPIQNLQRPQLIKWNVAGSTFILPERYTVNYSIGSGAYGMVVSAKDAMADDEKVAIKKIFNIFDHDYEFQKRIYREIKILKHFEHENIVCLTDLIPPVSFEEFQDVYIVTDLMETDLRQIIKSDQPLTDQHVQYFLYQILRGLKYIHSSNVLHRDLKPGNILLNSDCELKICDFGLSRGVDFDNNALMSTPYVATRWYRAPELLTMWRTASKSMDIWSVGCIFGELLGRTALFPGKNYLHQLDLIISFLGTPSSQDIVGCEKARKYILGLAPKKKVELSERFPTANPLALDLLEKMLQFNPDKRPTVEECLAHPYLASLHDISDEPVALPFNFEFENQFDNNPETMKNMIYQEIAEFNAVVNGSAGDGQIIGTKEVKQGQ